MYEEEILELLKELNMRLRNIERVFSDSRNYNGSDFEGCMTRIMLGVE